MQIKYKINNGKGLLVSFSVLVLSGCSQMPTPSQYSADQRVDTSTVENKETNDGSTHTHDGVVHTHPLPESGLNHTHNYNRSSASNSTVVSQAVYSPPVQTAPPVQNAPIDPNKHSHSGRVHSHVLPATGLRHSHGANQSQKSLPQRRPQTDPNSHMHGGVSHSHPLPITGRNHQHNYNRKPAVTQINKRYQPPVKLTPKPVAMVKRPAINNIKRYDYNVKYTDYTGNYAPKKITYSAPMPAPKPPPPKRFEYDYGGIQNERRGVVQHTHNGKSHSHLLPAGGVNHKHNFSKASTLSSTYKRYASGGSDVPEEYNKPTPSSSTSSSGLYTVQSKDTVFQVMRNTGVYWKDIIRLNNLKAPSYTIHPGQKLRLK